MIIQGFIPDWPGQKQHAKETAEIVRPFCDSVTILDDRNDYFTSQWEKAHHLFTGDILLWIMADVFPPKNCKNMIEKAIVFIEQKGVGIYSPNIDWNAHQYDKKKLRELWPNVYEVPLAEMALISLISRDVFTQMMCVNPQINKFGWGIDYLATATSRNLGKYVVRDYEFTAAHPKVSTYDHQEASFHLYRWLKTLSEPMLRQIIELMIDKNAVML